MTSARARLRAPLLLRKAAHKLYNRLQGAFTDLIHERMRFATHVIVCQGMGILWHVFHRCCSF
jgi:hypothetical protein